MYTYGCANPSTDKCTHENVYVHTHEHKHITHFCMYTHTHTASPSVREERPLGEMTIGRSSAWHSFCDNIGAATVAMGIFVI